MIDEARIQFSLFNELNARGHIAIIPNVSWSWLYWEADLISITKAKYMHEYEIKISKSDFKNDFKKRKHTTMTRTGRTTRIPNYFWYVAPEDAIPMCIPNYAGLILVVPLNKNAIDHKLIYVKKAMKLHSSKTPEVAIFKILRSIMFKYWNLAKIRDNWKIQKNLFG